MTVIRAFIAIDLAPDIRRKLERVSAELKERLRNVPVRWVSTHGIHLTLKFLGDVSVANLEVLKEILQAEAAGHAPFEIRVGELGAFPTIRKPRVVWVSVQGPQGLSTLQHNIENETARLGYAREERAFSPHLTLARVSRSATANDVRQIADVLAQTSIGLLGTMRVDSLHLFRSDLQPSGAVYTCLFTALLNSSTL
jgi:2'-5' RNA ligase